MGNEKDKLNLLNFSCFPGQYTKKENEMSKPDDFKDILCCPICKSDLTFNDNNIACASCGAEFNKNKHDIYNFIPKSNETTKVTSDAWDEYQWEIVEEERARRRMRKMVKYIPKDGMHLDVGTGRGEGTLEVSKIKETYGIDYGSKSLSIAKNYGLDQLYQADGRQLPFKDNSFHSMTALDVIEHIPDPLLFMKEAYRLLDKNGILILQTPVQETEDRKTWAKKLYRKYKILRIFDLIHLFRVKLGIIKVNSKNKGMMIPQPYDINLTEKMLLDIIADVNFHIVKRFKVNYYVANYFVQLFSYSDVFILSPNK